LSDHKYPCDVFTAIFVGWIKVEKYQKKKFEVELIYCFCYHYKGVQGNGKSEKTEKCTGLLFVMGNVKKEKKKWLCGIA